MQIICIFYGSQETQNGADFRASNPNIRPAKQQHGRKKEIARNLFHFFHLSFHCFCISFIHLSNMSASSSSLLGFLSHVPLPHSTNKSAPASLSRHRCRPRHHPHQRTATCLLNPKSPPFSNNDDGNFSEALSKLQTLRSRLEKAIIEQDFATAASLRDAIQSMETAVSPTSTLSVTLANETFYSALRTGSADAMASCWLSTNFVSCAHALGGLVTGFDDVIASWRRLFTAGKPADVKFEILSIHVSRNLAWVVCKQLITSERGKESLGGERVATNLFQRRGANWKVVHHHASPVVVEGIDSDRGDGTDEGKGNAGSDDDGRKGDGQSGGGAAPV